MEGGGEGWYVNSRPETLGELSSGPPPPLPQGSREGRKGEGAPFPAPENNHFYLIYPRP